MSRLSAIALSMLLVFGGVRLIMPLLEDSTLDTVTFRYTQTGESSQLYSEPISERLPLGVWWWHREDESVRYLEFVAAQGVSEIYYAAKLNDSSGSKAEIRGFVSAARKLGIDVYYLTGDYSWIHDDTQLIRRFEAFSDYQRSSHEAERFAGIQLDVEPHQDPNWSDATRNELLQKYIDLIVRTTDYFGPVDWVVPFWYREQESDLVDYRGSPEYLYRAVMLEANRLFVMSYRDTAQRMYDTARHYVEFAREQNRPIFLSALAHHGGENPENRHVYFYHRGYDYMMSELNLLCEMVDYPALGIAVHELRGWYQMWEQSLR